VPVDISVAGFSPDHDTYMSDYDIRPGGSLKLKGGVTEGGIVKKLVFILDRRVRS
jgi:hypothetical protein